jgi:hypothetical protein
MAMIASATPPLVDFRRLRKLDVCCTMPENA